MSSEPHTVHFPVTGSDIQPAQLFGLDSHTSQVPPALPPAHAPVIIRRPGTQLPDILPNLLAKCPNCQLIQLAAGQIHALTAHHSGTTGTWDSHPLSTAGTQLPYTNRHTTQRTPHLGKSLNSEFSEKPGQTVLVRYRHGQTDIPTPA